MNTALVDLMKILATCLFTIGADDQCGCKSGKSGKAVEDNCQFANHSSLCRLESQMDGILRRIGTHSWIRCPCLWQTRHVHTTYRIPKEHIVRRIPSGARTRIGERCKAWSSALATYAAIHKILHKNVGAPVTQKVSDS